MSGEYEDEKMNKKLSPKLRTKMDRTSTKPLELKRPNDVLEIIGKGTKCMKSMNFPTVIVKLLVSKLDKGRVYYAILELDNDELTGEISALMFSHPCAHKNTSFAEILPMGVVKNSKSIFVTPILQRKRYRRMFSKSSSFKIKTLIAGRETASSGGYLWNRYDLTQKSMQELIREVIELDIRRMSLHLMNRILPLKHRTKKSKHLRSIKASAQRVQQSGANLNVEQVELSKFTVDSTRSYFTQSFEVLGLVRKVGGNFARDRETPLNIYRGKDKKCHKRTTTPKSAQTSLEQLDKYWSILDVI